MEKVILVKDRPKQFTRVGLVGSLTIGGKNETILKRIGAEYRKSVYDSAYETIDILNDTYLDKRMNFSLNYSTPRIDIYDVPSYLVGTIDWFMGVNKKKTFKRVEKIGGEEVLIWTISCSSLKETKTFTA